VWIMNADGTQQTNLTNIQPANNWLPAWRPPGAE
jgi:Tol biopolymer transport system component